MLALFVALSQFEALIERLATTNRMHELCTGDLVLFAMLVSNRSHLTPQIALDALTQRGLRWPGERDEILAHISADLSKDPRFTRSGSYFPLAPGRALADETAALFTRFAVQKGPVRRPAAPKVPAPKAPPPKPTTTPKPPPPKATPARTTKPTTTPELPPKVPPAPPPETPAPIWVPLDPGAISNLLDQALRPLAHVALALDAAALSQADHFEELMAFALLRGVEAHTYQIETVRRVLRQHRGRALLADEVGLGKTIEAIMTLAEYRLRGMARRVLILAPPALLDQWAGELREKASIECTPLSELSAESLRAPQLVALASHGAARLARNADLLVSQAWDMVIVDEAHRLKNRETALWRTVSGLSSRFLLLLTATPVETSLNELYNLVTLLRPGQLATPAEFQRQYVDRKDPTNPKNRERLRALLAEVMVRNTRAGCGLKLPPRFVSTIVVDPGPGEAALYDGIRDLLRRFHAGGQTRLAASTLLIEAGSSAPAARATLDRLLAKASPEAAHGWLDGLRALSDLASGLPPSARGATLLKILRAHEEQALVFTRFRETQQSLAELLRGAGVPFVVLHGGLSAGEKQRAIERFRAGTGVLLTTDVGSEGHNLQHCHLLINFDLPWNPMVVEQRIGRLHRYGQTEEVRVYNLCGRGTMEDRLLDVLDRRLHLFELVVGEMDMVIGNITDGGDLEDRLLALAARDDAALNAGFEALATELLAARGLYEKARALDDTLFGEEFEA